MKEAGAISQRRRDSLRVTDDGANTLEGVVNRGRPFKIRIDRHVITGPYTGEVRGHRVGQRRRAGQRLSIRVIGEDANVAIRDDG